MRKHISKFISLIVSIIVIGLPSLSYADTPTITRANFPTHTVMRYGESTKTTILSTEYKTFDVTPQGQPSQGYSFPGGGSVQVNSSSGITINFNVSLSWGYLTLGVSSGKAFFGSPDVNINIPADGNTYRVKLRYHYKFTHVKIDNYQMGRYTGSTYTTWKERIRIDGLYYRV